LISAPPTWADEAVCATVDPDLWFPEKGGNNVAARAICRTCPVVNECLEYALTQEFNPDGIWGGTSTQDRRRIRRERGLAWDQQRGAA
jgi:WhiB family redox-sensing transcriptional regulator